MPLDSCNRKEKAAKVGERDTDLDDLNNLDTDYRARSITSGNLGTWEHKNPTTVYDQRLPSMWVLLVCFHFSSDQQKAKDFRKKSLKLTGVVGVGGEFVDGEKPNLPFHWSVPEHLRIV